MEEVENLRMFESTTYSRQPYSTTKPTPLWRTRVACVHPSHANSVYQNTGRLSPLSVTCMRTLSNQIECSNYEAMHGSSQKIATPAAASGFAMTDNNNHPSNHLLSTTICTNQTNSLMAHACRVCPSISRE